MFCYDTWKTSPDDASELHAFLEDRMQSTRDGLIEKIKNRLGNKDFPVDKLAMVIIAAMLEEVNGSHKIANLLGVDGLHDLDHWALHDNYDKYYETYQYE